MKKLIRSKESQFCVLAYIETKIFKGKLILEEITTVNCPQTYDYCCKCGVNAYGDEDIENLEYRCPFAHVEIIDNPDKENLSQKKIKVLMCKDWIIGELI
jgi:hypothetical protein